MSHQNQQQEPIIACNPGAIDPAERDAHAELAKELFSSSTILEVKELANGYGFRLPLDTPMLHKAASFIANDRLCCPFFTFTLVVGEQLWLEISGTQEVKDLIRADVLTMMETGVFPAMDDLQTAYNAAAGHPH